MDANTFLATGHIAFWLLLVGLFLPRFALFVAWLEMAYPPNPLPDLVNFALWLFFPRFLMAFYIYTDMGTNNIWFWAYIVLGIAGLFGETGYAPPSHCPPYHRQSGRQDHDHGGRGRGLAFDTGSAPRIEAWNWAHPLVRFPR